MAPASTETTSTTAFVASDPSRLEQFRTFWEAARELQARKSVALSPVFPQALIAAEMAEGRHFMALRPDGTCVGYFSITVEDRAIWGERECGDAVYVHRMCVNPRARGCAMARDVLDWARRYATARGRRWVRMDTWADNPRLVDYYVSCGYRHVGFQDIGHDPSLSSHYHGITLALFQNPA